MKKDVAGDIIDLDNLTAPYNGLNVKIVQRDQDREVVVMEKVSHHQTKSERPLINRDNINHNKSRKPKRDDHFATFPDHNNFPETIKISSTFAGRPRFSISQDTEGGLEIKPELTDIGNHRKFLCLTILNLVSTNSLNSTPISSQDLAALCQDLKQPLMCPI